MFEALRMRRLCEKNSDFLESLNYLKKKASLSQMPKKLMESIISVAQTWNDHFDLIKIKQTKQKKPTSFSALLKLSHQQKSLHD